MNSSLRHQEGGTSGRYNRNSLRFERFMDGNSLKPKKPPKILLREFLRLDFTNRLSDRLAMDYGATGYMGFSEEVEYEEACSLVNTLAI